MYSLGLFINWARVVLCDLKCYFWFRSVKDEFINVINYNASIIYSYKMWKNWACVEVWWTLLRLFLSALCGVNILWIDLKDPACYEFCNNVIIVLFIIRRHTVIFLSWFIKRNAREDLNIFCEGCVLRGTTKAERVCQKNELSRALKGPSVWSLCGPVWLECRQ